jgi:hypothetical protein
VLLWEILTGGLEPYPELDNVQAARFVEYSTLANTFQSSDAQRAEVISTGKHPSEVGRVDEQVVIPFLLGLTLSSCFEREPSKRPNFKKIIKILDEVEEEVESNPFYGH